MCRSRGRNITSETFVCMHRAQPMFVEQKGNLSMYSNWHQVSINEAESKLNLLYMGMCSTRPRTGVKPFWRYSIANRDHGQYKMTHSSFWEYRNKVCQYYSPAWRQSEQGQNGKNEPEEVFCPIVDVPEADTKPVVDEASDVHSTPKIGTASSSVAESSREKSPRVATPKYIPSSEAAKLAKTVRKQDPVIGGYRTDEVYVYVRGRGRGRYVCDRCGIRCKKPSMLNKHIKSHTDIRPYKCKECNFSFKTKGSGNESDNEDGLVIASPDDDRYQYDDMDSILDRAASSDDETDDHLPPPEDSNPYRKYGQENILFERSAHTPPSRWMLVDEEVDSRWPDAERMRNCSSAPPSAASPSKEECKEDSAIPSTTMAVPSVPVSVVLSTSPTTFSHVTQQEHSFAVHQPTAPIYPYLSKEVGIATSLTAGY
ncbi:unnamed protein product [Heligmosomoides polygyrus]|uniref:C2H2-type domain-containing protein n=1 Tax=Heligmosomoides polygyrus TaxID=6339 RepID=A0A3P8BBB2_HELPZ|nr:unnamed protein product [Heligmosomoides polygyrus]